MFFKPRSLPSTLHVIRCSGEEIEVSQGKKISRVVSASRKEARECKRRLRVLSWEEVGRPWPPGGESLLDAPRQNEQLRQDLVKKLLTGEDEQREARAYSRFSKRDFERTSLVVRTFAPHLAPEIEFLIRVKYPRPRNTPGHPRDPMAERAALAFELLKSCYVRCPAETINSILNNIGKHITEESIERDYRRRNKVRLVRVPGGFFAQVPAGDIHRVLLWQLHALLSLSPVSEPVGTRKLMRLRRTH